MSSPDHGTAPGRLSLAGWRKAHGVSQKEMAERLSARLGRKVHAPSVCQWEHGVMPGADAAEAIRKVTGGKVVPGSFGRRGGKPSATPEAGA